MGHTHSEFWFENLKGGDYLRDLGIEGKTALKLLLDK
jgi:hypothetical protein